MFVPAALGIGLLCPLDYLCVATMQLFMRSIAVTDFLSGVVPCCTFSLLFLMLLPPVCV